MAYDVLLLATPLISPILRHVTQTLQDWAHTLSAKILSLRYIRTVHILLDKVFKNQTVRPELLNATSPERQFNLVIDASPLRLLSY